MHLQPPPLTLTQSLSCAFVGWLPSADWCKSLKCDGALYPRQLLGRRLSKPVHQTKPGTEPLGERHHPHVFRIEHRNQTSFRVARRCTGCTYMQHSRSAPPTDPCNRDHSLSVHTLCCTGGQRCSNHVSLVSTSHQAAPHLCVFSCAESTSVCLDHGCQHSVLCDAVKPMHLLAIKLECE